MKNIPPRPIGSGADARFFQWVFDSINQLRPGNAPGVLTSETTQGVQRKANSNANSQTESGEARWA